MSSQDEMNMLIAFCHGFVKGARETPKAYFAPLVAVWRLLVRTTEDLIGEDAKKR